MEQKNQTGHKNIIVMGKLLMNEGITSHKTASLLWRLHTKFNSYKDSLAGYPTCMLWIKCLSDTPCQRVSEGREC